MPRGKSAPWSDDDRIMGDALDMSRRPVNGSQTGGYGMAIRTLEKTLTTMNGLKGDELRRYADRHFFTKPELAEAIQKLRALQDEAQRHFSRSYLRAPRPGAVA